MTINPLLVLVMAFVVSLAVTVGFTVAAFGAWLEWGRLRRRHEDAADRLDDGTTTRTMRRRRWIPNRPGG
jgi:hypothetical protein